MSEIGAFYRTIVVSERERKADKMVRDWMSNHYDHKQLMETIQKDFKIDLTKKEIPPSEVQSEWKRLAGFMKNKK